MLTEPSHLLLTVLAVASIVLAYFSWRYIELPARKRGILDRRRVFYLAGFSSIVIAICGGVIYINNGFRERLPENIVWETLGEKRDKLGEVCDLRFVADFAGLKACEFGDLDGSHEILLYGDSHADAISYVLDREFKKLNIKGVRIDIEGCETIPFIFNTRRTKSDSDLVECKLKFEKLLEYIRSQKSNVIVVSRWTFRLYPIDGVIDQMPYKNSSGVVEKETYREYATITDGHYDFSARAKAEAVEQFVEGLLSTKVNVAIVYPIPEMAWNIARENWIHYVTTGSLLSSISIPASEFTKRNEFIEGIFDQFRTYTNFVPIRPFDIFCDTFMSDRCVAQFDSIPFYYDDDHLSDSGANYLVQAILTHMGSP